MNSKIRYFTLISLLLILGVACASASEIDDSNVTLSQDVSAIGDIGQSEVDSVNLDDVPESVCEAISDSANLKGSNNAIFSDSINIRESEDEVISESADVQDSSYASGDLEESLKDGESGVIVVNDWDELQYYCSLKDDDYVLKLKENTNFYPTNPKDSNYQIKVYNKVTIIGSEGSYIGYNSSKPPSIDYAAIIVPDDAKAGITMENVEFKWISTNYLPDGVFLQMGGKRNNVFKNCQFSNINTNGGHSCIVYLKKGTATLENCSFINCTTDYGAVSVYDPNSVKTTDMVVRNCYFEGNYAKTEPGCINNCGKLTVYNTTFLKNRSFWWAGAIHTHNHGNTTIYDSNFTDNVAGWNGGALYTYSYLQIYNTVFVGNNCTTNSGGGAIGACAYLSNPHIYIENCLFEKNENLCWYPDELSSGDGVGGAIGFMDEGSLVVLNTTFIANSAAHGTAISANQAGEYGSPNVIIKNNNFINHTRVGDVLYVNLIGSSGIIEDNYFYGNSVEFSSLTLSIINEGKDQATLQVSATLSNPHYYDEDILNKTLYDVYLDGEYLKTVDSAIFTVDFDSGTMADVYVVPTISNSKSNLVTITSVGSFIFVSKSIGDDGNNGTLRECPVNTLGRALELADEDFSIVILDGAFDEGNFQIDKNLTIIGSVNSTLTNNTSFTVNANNFTLKSMNVCNLSSGTFINQAKGFLVVSNCIFNNNGDSNLFDADNVNISKSIFTNNKIISLNNGFTTIKNSILLNNTKIIDNNLANINLDYNWWGNTLNNISKPSDLNINNWLLLNGSSALSILELGQSTKVQFDSYLVENGVISKYSDLVKFNWEISALNGTVDRNLTNYNSNIVYTQNASGIGVLTAKYNDISFDLHFDFVKFTPNLSVNASDIMYGQSLNVLIVAPDDIADSRGTFKVSVGGMSLTKLTQYTSFKFDGLDAGDYEIIVIFSGNEKYANHTVSSNISVKKYSSWTNITAGPVELGSDLIITVTTSPNTAGNVTLAVNNISETLILDNNQASYTIGNIARGDYHITAVYNGNEKYEISEASLLVEVDNQVPQMRVSIENSSYGEAAIIDIILNDDATGFAYAAVEGITNSSEVIGGRAKVYIYGVNVGESHEVTVFYTGDDNYYNRTETADMNVSKGNFTFAMNSEDIYIGHDEVITIFVPAKTKGKFTINDTILTIPMSGEVTYTIKGLDIGEYTVYASFSGDNYNDVSNFTTFKVMEFDSPQWNSSGADTENTQKSDIVSISNGGVSWIAKINSTVRSNIVIDSIGNIYIATDDGIYSFNSDGNLRWTYLSDGRYGNFTGLAIGRDVIISPKAGDTLYFVSQNTGERYGYSNIYQASSLYVPVIDANANIYTVSEYQYETSSYNLAITPYSLWENGGDPILVSLGNFRPKAAPVVNDDIMVVLGQSSIMLIDRDSLSPIFVKSGSFRNVRPVIGDGNIVYAILDDSIFAYTMEGAHMWDAKISDGPGDNLLIDNDLNLIYATNANGNLYSYNVFTGEETLVSDLNITSGILIDGNHNLYFASGNLFYGIDSNGTVLWKTNLGSRITGTPVMNKEGIIYVASEDNRLFALSDVSLIDPGLSVSVSDIVQGENALIKISINNQAEGNVSFTLAGLDYSFDASKGDMTFAVSNLMAGNYNIEVVYPGDLRFDSAIKRVSFTVKAIASLDTQVSGNTLAIVLPADATGSLSVNVNGQTYLKDLIGGKAMIDLPYGTYDAVVSYSGDGKYAGFVKTVPVTIQKPVQSAKVTKKATKIIAKKKTFKRKLKVKKYTVTLKSGKALLKKLKLTLKINKKTYKATTNAKGKATFKIKKLTKKGKYTAIIRFAGSKYYKASSKKVKIIVK